MRSFRAAVPALFGLFMLYVGINALAHDLRYYSENPIGAVRGSIVPITIGVALLLVALAISRRARVGYLLGLATAALMVLGGVWVIAIEIGYISSGANAAQWAPVALVGAGGWMALWALYARSIRRARASFTPAWLPLDRRFAIVLTGLIAFSAAAHLGLGVVETSIAHAGVASRAQAEKLTQGTSLAVDANDVIIDPSGATGTNPPVQRMTLEITVRSLATYELATVPTLCLTDLATANNATYKPDAYCWGVGGLPITLDAGFSRLIVDDGSVTFKVDVRRADSLCAFGSGRWMAELRLAPRVVPEDGKVAVVEWFSLFGTFQVLADGQSLPDDPSAPTAQCIA